MATHFLNSLGSAQNIHPFSDFLLEGQKSSSKIYSSTIEVILRRQMQAKRRVILGRREHFTAVERAWSLAMVNKKCKVAEMKQHTQLRASCKSSHTVERSPNIPASDTLASKRSSNPTSEKKSREQTGARSSVVQPGIIQ